MTYKKRILNISLRIQNLNRLVFLGLYLALISIFSLTSTDKQFIYQKDENVCGIYCQMALDYSNKLFNQQFDIYYFQKSLVSLLTYLTVNFMNISNIPTTINIITEVFSLFALFVGGYYWWKIANFSKFSTTNFWLVFFGIFGSQLFIKVSPYSQDGSDNISFGLGMAVLYFTIIGSRKGIFIAYALSFLVQPQLRILIIPIIIFFGYKINVTKNEKIKSRILPRITFLTYVLFFVSSLIIFTYIFPLSHGVNHSLTLFTPLSIIISSIILTKLMVATIPDNLIKLIFNILPLIKNRLITLVFIEIVFQTFIRFIGKGEIFSINSKPAGQLYFLLGNYFHAIAFPFLWIVAPIIFFGPMVILFIIFYKKIFNFSIFSTNFGLGLSFLLIILLIPNTESRHHIAYIPWIFYFLVKNVEFSANYLFIIYIPLMILTSRFYGEYASLNPQNDTYLFSWGPWYSFKTYYIATLISLLALLIHGLIIRTITKFK